MSQRDVCLELDFAVPPARLWDALTDHASMGKWVGARVRLIVRGDERGVGAVRRIRLGPSIVDEEVVYADAPRRLVYRVVRGAGLSHHRGEVLIEPKRVNDVEGSHLTWNIRMVTPVPGLSRVMSRVIGAGVGRGLVELRGLIGG
ncbi:MAG: SRPBCC family protein [Deltaproteobacteria bacterium]|nr:SRPBCC family protein [Deltaproteobacteria bacterium]